MRTTRGIIAEIHNISDEDIDSVVNFYRSTVDSRPSPEQLRPYAINSLTHLSKQEVLRKILVSPAKFNETL